VNSLNRGLADYCEQGMHSFHTPGHKGRAELLASLAFPGHDLTELPGLDMLHNPQGLIDQAQKKAAEIYGADETFFLVNGATSGNQAMFLALTAGHNRKKIRVERRAHRSVAGALILSGLEPEYIPAVIHPDFKLPLGLDSKNFCSPSEHIGAFHLTSPGYYGTLADLDTIIEWRNRNNPSIPVLVDQAHGAHLTGDLFPVGAVAQGADLVVHSSHKTLLALTQSAMIHVRGDRIDRTSLRKSLELLQTSSPSYLFLESLENSVLKLQEHSWQDLYEEVMLFRKRMDGRLRILTSADTGTFGIQAVDWSKILINISSLETNVTDFVNILRSSFKIEPELWDENNILFMLGMGSKPDDVRTLSNALEILVRRFRSSPVITGQAALKRGENILWEELGSRDCLPSVRLTPREAWLAVKKTIKVKDSLGRISGETISIYPPGIPLVIAGEEINSLILSRLTQAENHRWQGWQGYKQGEISVIDF